MEWHYDNLAKRRKVGFQVEEEGFAVFMLFVFLCPKSLSRNGR
jgi:hypothetical protein